MVHLSIRSSIQGGRTFGVNLTHVEIQVGLKSQNLPLKSTLFYKNIGFGAFSIIGLYLENGRASGESLGNSGLELGTKNEPRTESLGSCKNKM